MESTDKNILKELKEIKSDREMKDIVDKIIDLQRQKVTPDREGMIKALFNAQMLAAPEIVQTTIQSTGAVYSKSWDDFSNQELYNMLFSYTEGLIKHGMNKFGKELFQKAYEETIKELEQ